jgi:cysteinyl-tRNA synthetase
MDLLLYNTLTHRKEIFIPIKKGKVSLYTCGPTVYNYAHIGNLRSYINWDILRRVLEFNTFDVKHVMNITDVGHLTSDSDTGEDKMLKGARREKKTVWEIAEFYTNAFKEDITKLNIKEPKIWCKATKHIKEQIEMIQKLEKKGFTYTKGGNVYFDTSTFAKYGEFAGLNLNEKGKSRVDVDLNKKNSHDFVLWFTKSKFLDQEMKWDSPFGIGYPGWHIECSAMATKYLGTSFDIHTGGIDHINVHHTNEIAQAECSMGVHPWVKYWLHSEFLVIDKGKSGTGEKMAKSGKNFLTLQTLEEKGFDPLDYRYFCLTAQFRRSLQFSYEALDGARSARRKLQEKVWELQENGAKKGVFAQKEKYSLKFLTSINDDLNMPKALAVVWDLMKDTTLKISEKYSLFLQFDSVLGFNLSKKKPKVHIPKEVMDIVQLREVARSSKNWKKADELRKKIVSKGYAIADSPNGFEITKV